MNKHMFLFALFCCSACTNMDLPNHHWSDLEPYVMTVSPEAGYAFSESTTIRMELSQPLLSETLSDSSIFMISKNDFEIESGDWQELADAVVDGDIACLPLTFTLDNTHQILDVTVDVSMAEVNDYVLVVTPDVLSEQRVPINQTHVSGSERYFMAGYSLTPNSLANSVSASSAGGAESESVNSGESSGATAVSSQSTESTLSDTEGQSQATSASSQSTDTDTHTDSDEGVGSEVIVVATPAFKIDSLVISEIVTDPQQDFNDSSGGNAVPFDDFVGNGIVGSTDEYIELFNGSESSLNLIGYRLEMLDGTDVDQIVSAETWVDVNFSGESDFSMFLPGDYAVLGNPDGAINNAMTLNLWDAEGDLVESLFIEDANADEISTEAYSLDFDTGFWDQTEASPGF